MYKPKIKKEGEFTESRFFMNPARHPITRAENDYFMRQDLIRAARGNYPVGYEDIDD